jgi:Protein of unknown function (DUF2778)
MLGTEATFDEVSFEGGDGPRRVLQKVLPGAAALALAGAVGVWALHLRDAAAPEAGTAPLAQTAPAAASKPFGDIVIDANVLAELKRAAPADASSQVASLEPAQPFSSPPIPLPRLEAFPPVPPTSQTDSAPLPPAREAPEVGESVPLPPPRPPELGAPQQASAPPERHAAQPSVAAVSPAAPVDSRNIFQKMFGLGQASAPSVAPAPAQRQVAVRTDTAPSSTTVSTATASAVSESRGEGRGPLFSLPSPFGNSAPTSGYDSYTAVYDISARMVYLPDGTKLEAHSGLGGALDDPRYVSERAVGPTPPHLYQLTLREGSFHGVQAIRLNPIGEGGIYGRAGLLAHPFMLGPNGDSNGCVSVKDYNAFLRAYQNGRINKLVVVAKL